MQTSYCLRKRNAEIAENGKSQFSNPEELGTEDFFFKAKIPLFGSVRYLESRDSASALKSGPALSRRPRAHSGSFRSDILFTLPVTNDSQVIYLIVIKSIVARSFLAIFMYDLVPYV